MTYDQLKAFNPNASEAFLRMNASDRQPIIANQPALKHSGIAIKVSRLEEPQPSESKNQQDLIKWWASECVNHNLPEESLMAFPLQGFRTARNGARMKAEGMRRGTPDLFLAVPINGQPGLWIENKTRKGVISTHQKLMLAGLNARGYSVMVCRSYAEAVAAVLAYLNPITASHSAPTTPGPIDTTHPPPTKPPA